MSASERKQAGAKQARARRPFVLSCPERADDAACVLTARYKDDADADADDGSALYVRSVDDGGDSRFLNTSHRHSFKRLLNVSPHRVLLSHSA